MFFSTPRMSALLITIFNKIKMKVLFIDFAEDEVLREYTSHVNIVIPRSGE